LLKILPNRSQLETSDRLRVDAINFTIGRDYAGAIQANQELVRLAPTEAQAYVDLGRAYEKNEDLKQAIESNKQAQERDPQYATAFLRAGNLYARDLDQANAIASFDRAETIYQALGSFEGQAEVSFQRGFLFNQTGKLDEARQHLGRALELAKTTNNEYLQVKTLQKLGDVETDANNYAKARELMQQALTLAREKAIDNLVRRGLVDIGNTFLVESNFAEAEKYYRESLNLCVQQKDARNTARARLSLAGVAERQAQSDEVIRLLDLVLPFYQQGGYRKELLQALALYGRAKVQKGDNEAASQAFEKELSAGVTGPRSGRAAAGKLSASAE
jgi:tetratricopeptide (TPR) repeat protein